MFKLEILWIFLWNFLSHGIRLNKCIFSAPPKRRIRSWNWVECAPRQEKHKRIAAAGAFLLGRRWLVLLLADNCTFCANLMRCGRLQQQQYFIYRNRECPKVVRASAVANSQFIAPDTHTHTPTPRMQNQWVRRRGRNNQNYKINPLGTRLN